MRGIAMAILFLCVCIGQQVRKMQGEKKPEYFDAVALVHLILTLIVIAGGW